MPQPSAPTTVFIRDDDIGAWTPGAASFVDIFRLRAIPVSYQVIPALLTAECAEKLRAIYRENPELIELGQHGLAHRMTVGGREYSHEFGRERDYAAQRAAIREGRAIMTSLLGPAFDGRMFTPPRHRFNRDTVLAAAAEGFDIFSAADYGDALRRFVYRVGRLLGVGSVANRGISHHPGERPEAPIHELSITVAVDDGPPRSRRVGDVMAEIDRAARRSPIVGLMLHHEAWHSATGRTFLAQLADRLVERSDLRIALPRDLVARPTAPALLADAHAPEMDMAVDQSRPPAADADAAEVTIVIVSYKTRDLSVKAVETLIDNSPGVAMHIVFFDNASGDGSAEAVTRRFPQVEVIANDENIGFARANNRVAELARTEWLLLLNPDTETYPGAIASLLAFAKAHPEAGIVGGQTRFPDGSLNPSSCWQRMTAWSTFASAVGLSSVFPNSALFNSEAIGGWQRDSVRQVDIVVGCFLLIRLDLWRQLGGFNARYFMYGEDADLCLRARKLGYRPMITPDARIMHLVGASTANRAEKVVAVMRAKATLVRDHWPRWQVPLGLGLLWLWVAMRGAASLVLPGTARRARLRHLWSKRRWWLAGFPPA